MFGKNNLVSPILAIKGGLPMPAMLNALVLPKKCGSHVIEILTNRSIKTPLKRCLNSVLTAFYTHWVGK